MTKIQEPERISVTLSVEDWVWLIDFFKSTRDALLEDPYYDEDSALAEEQIDTLLRVFKEVLRA